MAVPSASRALIGVVLRLVLAGVALGFIRIGVMRLEARFGHLRPELAVLRFTATALLVVFTGASLAGVVAGVGGVAPTLVLLAAAVPAIVLGTLWAPRYLEGLWLVLRTRAGSQDRVRIGDTTGRLAEVGLLRVTVEHEDGRWSSVPIGAVGGATVMGVHLDAPVVTVDLPASADLERARAAAVVSPYRDPGRRVELEPTAAGARLTAAAWGHEAGRRLADQVREAAEAGEADAG
ncbi:MAG: hypothetical protein ACI8PZ_007155 [Myxococcota bacterium]